VKLPPKQRKVRWKTRLERGLYVPIVLIGETPIYMEGVACKRTARTMAKAKARLVRGEL